MEINPTIGKKSELRSGIAYNVPILNFKILLFSCPHAASLLFAMG
jgi:hypothetical protein